MRLYLVLVLCLCIPVTVWAGTQLRLGKLRKQQVLNNADPLQFMVLGDWGVGPAFTATSKSSFQPIHTAAGLTTVQFGHLLSRTENAVIDQFQQVASTFQPEFIISAGDQFYDNGLTSTQDQQFQNKFTNRFTAPSVQIPWYPCLGNHDYYFSPDSQLNRASDDPRWQFPARYYSFTKQFQGNSVLFVVMDVNPAIVKYRLEKELNPTKGKYATVQIVQNLQAAKASWPIQLAWAQQTLAASDADWKIVIGHEPIFSFGGVNSFSELQRDLQPILELQGVSVYFSGHYHTLELHNNNGVDYIISGAASQIPYPIGNGTAAALKDYFANTQIPSPDPTIPATLAPTVAPPGTTAYPPETAPPQGVPPQQTFFVGGSELSLPGFMSCSINSTHMHTTVYGMANDGTWSVVATRDTPKRQSGNPTQSPTTQAPTQAPTTQAPTTQAPTTAAPTTPVPTTTPPTTPVPTTSAPTVPGPHTSCSSPSFGGIIDGYNLWSFGTWNASNAAVGGAVAVGGSASISAYSIGASLNQPNQMNLIVGGALSWLQGSLSGTGLVQGAANIVSVSSAGIISNSQLPAPLGSTFFTSQLATVTNLVQQHTSGTPPLSSCGSSISSSGTWTITGISQTMCRVQIDGTTLSNSDIMIQGDTTTVVVIVITGTNWSWSSHAMHLNGGITAQTILWVSLATSIDISAVAFQGSLVAPYADVTFNNGLIIGQLIVNSVSGTGGINGPLFCVTPQS